jgi:L-asparaginase
MSKIPLILYTGGTIGMVDSEHGQVADEGLPDSLRLHPDLQDRDFDCVSITPLIDSALVSVDTWQKILDFIRQKYHSDKHDSIILLHGTDTLAFTAAFLSFILNTFPVPIFITGSMRSIHDHTEANPSDGWANIVQAFNASTEKTQGVWVVFANKIMHGARVSKINSDIDDAFHTPNGDAAFLRNKDNKNSTYSANRTLKPLTVDTITFTPVTNEALLRKHITLPMDVLFLRVYGSGTVPDFKDFFKDLQLRNQQNLLTIAISQAVAGGLKLGHYAASNALLDNGCISAETMTYEAAVAKAYYLYQISSDLSEIKKIFAENLVGELG